MTTEQDVKDFMIQQLARIKAEGYSTLDIDAYTSGHVTFQGYNQHTGIHRGESLDEIIEKINNASKSLPELFMETAAKMRAQADSIEAKAKALLADQTPALI